MRRHHTYNCLLVQVEGTSLDVFLTVVYVQYSILISTNLWHEGIDITVARGGY